jgi:hypothetical protein
VTDTFLLGVIALSVAVMAIVQVGAIVAGLRVARKVESMATELETGIKPLLSNLTTLSAEATRAATRAATQVDRLDQVFTDLTGRVEKIVSGAQYLVNGPAREGMAIVAGIRAALSAFQGLRAASRRRAAPRPGSVEEEEESLFIG